MRQGIRLRRKIAGDRLWGSPGTDAGRGRVIDQQSASNERGEMIGILRMSASFDEACKGCSGAGRQAEISVLLDVEENHSPAAHAPMEVVAEPVCHVASG